MKRTLTHISAFLTLVAAIMAGMLSSGCEGPGVIEQNVYLEDTLIKTVYDTIYSERVIEIFAYDTLIIRSAPQRIEIATDRGPYTGELAYDTIKVVYEDTVFTQLQPRSISEGDDLIVLIEEIPGSRRIQQIEDYMLMTVDLRVKYMSGKETIIQGQEFMIPISSESILLNDSYFVEYVNGTVIWSESNLGPTDEVSLLDFSKTLFYPPQALPDFSRTILLTKEFISGNEAGGLISYGISGSMSLSLAPLFSPGYVDIQNNQDADTTEPYQTPLFLDSLIFDTGMVRIEGTISQSELGSLADQIIYFKDGERTVIKAEDALFSSMDSYIYLRMPSVNNYSLPGAFELLIITEIQAGFDTGWGRTAESMVITHRIGFTK